MINLKSELQLFLILLMIKNMNTRNEFERWKEQNMQQNRVSWIMYNQLKTSLEVKHPAWASYLLRGTPCPST